jgi:ABC-type transport system substrate-binding protein
VDAFNSTLDRAERTRQVVQLTKIYCDAVPAISLWYPTQPLAHTSSVRGPVIATSNALIAWNMHQWGFR